MDVVADDMEGDKAGGRVELVVAVEVDEEDDRFRLWGIRAGGAAGVGALDGAALLAGPTPLEGRPRTLPLGDDVL